MKRLYTERKKTYHILLTGSQTRTQTAAGHRPAATWEFTWVETWMKKRGWLRGSKTWCMRGSKTWCMRGSNENCHVQAGLQPACPTLRVCNPHQACPATPYHVQAGLQPACPTLRVCNPRQACSAMPSPPPWKDGEGASPTRYTREENLLHARRNFSLK